MSLDGISMHPLSIELDRAIAGGRIDKINQPNKQSIIMALRMPGKNIMLHISINPQNPAMHIVDKAPENPPEPPMFCMVLRKHLETGRIACRRPDYYQIPYGRANGQIQQYYSGAGRHDY